ncbi:hypothetical protein EJP02_223 [Escherichia phage EJP2]|nr:hypothetical protein EJP02_223 [Escherichia phage EJP2]
MAVFSNLEGTMKKTFFLGKGGVRFSSVDYAPGKTEMQVQNYQGTELVPVSAGAPINPSHLVTLNYFNEHNAGGSGGALSGTDEPDVSLGINGDTYFQVDGTSIVQIFFKDQDIWKPFKKPAPTTDSDYVTAHTSMPGDFVLQGSQYVFSLPESVHKRGSDLLVQVQDPGGNTIGMNVTLDAVGNVTISTDAVPTEYVIVKLIGATTMTAPYSSPVNKAQWSSSAGKYSLTIPQSTHGQEIGPLYLAIMENEVDSATSSSPYNVVTVDSTIDVAGNVTFSSYLPFSGKVVISGK